MPAPSNRLLTLTNTKLVAGVVDGAMTMSPITARFLGNAQRWSGAQIDIGFKHKKTGLGGAFTGLQEFTVTDVSSTIKLSYYIGAYEQPIVIPGIEYLLNRISEETATSMMGFKMEEAKVELAEGLSDLLWGNNDTNFNSIRDFADDGGQTANIGNQARGTYATLQGTDTASGGLISLTKIRTLKSAISAGSILGYKPTIGASNETVWDLIESILTPYVRANYDASGMPQVSMKSRGVVRGTELGGVALYDSIYLAGVPIVADEKTTIQSFYLINEDQEEWYGAKDPDLQSVDLGESKDLKSPLHAAPSKFHGFNYQPLMRPINQYGLVGHLFLFGQLIGYDPGCQGVLTGVTGV